MVLYYFLMKDALRDFTNSNLGPAIVGTNRFLYSNCIDLRVSSLYVFFFYSNTDTRGSNNSCNGSIRIKKKHIDVHNLILFEGNNVRYGCIDDSTHSWID